MRFQELFQELQGFLGDFPRIQQVFSRFPGCCLTSSDEFLTGDQLISGPTVLLPFRKKNPHVSLSEVEFDPR